VGAENATITVGHVRAFGHKNRRLGQSYKNQNRGKTYSILMEVIRKKGVNPKQNIRSYQQSWKWRIGGSGQSFCFGKNATKGGHWSLQRERSCRRTRKRHYPPDTQNPTSIPLFAACQKRASFHDKLQSPDEKAEY